jgi:hypothetical protein
MNAWLLDTCIAYAKAHHHPELTEQTIWDVFERERPMLVPYAGKFDGFHAVPASVSKTCLVRLPSSPVLNERARQWSSIFFYFRDAPRRAPALARASKTRRVI